ncbi:uracil-DNA glycosylase [Aliarcobacter vitoriensis]|uniref:Uracil-DNA glycosylase n=1 Tax=Aliarcobacter vitoriensis TaxID=2011099 RepID=A0A366MQX5_9BACT|nr:uracil-DNA glycosylase [Aliarcobacter vitoriensis]RBQ28447.1 uracil-DNA glycosylase [Aliarcobacter vitoriensis]
MTKQVKNQILKYLYNQKLFGFNYHSNLNINFYSSCDFNLPNSLNDLKNSVANCHLCELSKGRKNTLFSYGNNQSKLMFVCDEPTKSEDELGIFYSGNTGELLSKMIENVLNIKKEEVYITTLAKCRGSKEASFQNFESCSCYFHKQLEIINPRLIIAVGEKVYSYLMKNDEDFSQNRGKTLNFNSSLLIPIFSPIHLLKNPSLKKDTYLDMLKIKNLYEELN